MRISILLGAVWLLAHSILFANAPGPVTISGQCTQPVQSNLVLEFFDHPLDQTPSSIEVPINEARHWKMQAVLQQPTFVKILYLGKSLELYLEPEDQLELAIDEKTWPQKVGISGMGADHNLFLQDFKKMKSQLEEKIQLESLFNSNIPQAYFQACEQYRKSIVAFINAWPESSKDNFSQAFMDYLEVEQVEKWQGLYLKYALAHPDLKMPQEWLAVVHKVPAAQNEKLVHPAFWDYLHWHTKVLLEHPDWLLANQAEPVYASVTVDKAYVLKNPADPPVLAGIQSGERVLWLGEKSLIKSIVLVQDSLVEGFWQRVRDPASGEVGWVHEAYLKVLAPEIAAIQPTLAGIKPWHTGQAAAIALGTYFFHYQGNTDGNVFVAALNRYLKESPSNALLSLLYETYPSQTGIAPQLKQVATLSQVQTDGTAYGWEEYAFQPKGLDTPWLQAMGQSTWDMTQELIKARNQVSGKIDPVALPEDYTSSSLRKSSDEVFLDATPVSYRTYPLRVRGTCSACTEKQVRLVLDQNTITDKPVSYLLNLNQQGKFQEAIQIPGPVSATLYLNETSIPLYLEPNEEFEIEVDAQSFPDKAQFRGNAADKQQFLHQKHLRFAHFDQYLAGMREKGVAEDEYLQTLQDMLLSQQRFQEQFTLPPAFADYCTAVREYWGAWQTLEFGLHDKTHPSSGLLGAMPVVEYSRTECLPSLEYRQFLEAFLEYQLTLKVNEGLDPWALALQYLDGKPLEYVQARQYIAQCRAGKAITTLPAIKAYLDKTRYTEYGNALRLEYNEHLPMQPGRLAPNVALISSDGENKDLKAFRGQPYLMGFWTTWKDSSLQAFLQLDAPGIQKIAINLDESDEVWLDRSQVYDQQDVKHYWAGPGAYLSDIARLYKVRKLPWMILVDAEGRIVGFSSKIHELGGWIKQLKQR